MAHFCTILKLTDLNEVFLLIFLASSLCCLDYSISQLASVSLRRKGTHSLHWENCMAINKLDTLYNVDVFGYYVFLSTICMHVGLVTYMELGMIF